MPVYDVSDYIERCMRSVMNQTYSCIECIIVDDVTPDDSIIKCKRLIDSYSGPIRFRIIYHEHNRGLSAARNTGTNAATGDYIFYLDSDDVITDDCIEILMAPILLDSTIDMVMGSRERVPEGSPLPQKSHRGHHCQDLIGLEAIRDYFFGGKRTVLSAWNKLIKKDFVNRFAIMFKEDIIWEDTLWTFYLMKYLEHLYIINDVTYYYCRRLHSITLGTDVQTKRYYWGVVLHEISNHFTPGDSNREAKFYFRGFCRQYIHCSNDELYKETARNFKKELSYKYDFIQCISLLVIGVLSKLGIGKEVFHALGIVYKFFRR